MFNYFLRRFFPLVTLFFCLFYLSGCDRVAQKEKQLQTEAEIARDHQFKKECQLLRETMDTVSTEIGFPSTKVNLDIKENASPILLTASSRLAASHAEEIPEKIKVALEKLYQLKLTEQSIKKHREEITFKLNQLKEMIESSRPELEQIRESVTLLANIDIDTSSAEYKQAQELIGKAAKAETVPTNLTAIRRHENELSELKIKLFSQQCLLNKEQDSDIE
ncbi:MAG: hypothetical protein WA865_15490 [Spirulinaceae cyanobacterium]